jgi:hypothetical protein
MLDKECKLLLLFDFYMEYHFSCGIPQFHLGCPYYKSKYAVDSCSSLCGQFFGTGAVCPCVEFGASEASNRLEDLLIEEGYIDA